MKIKTDYPPIDFTTLAIADKATLYFFVHGETDLHNEAYKKSKNEQIKTLMRPTIATNDDEVAEVGRTFGGMSNTHRQDWLINQGVNSLMLNSLLLDVESAKKFREETESKVSIFPVKPKAVPNKDLKLEQMAASQRAALLLERLHPLAVHEEAQVLYRYNDGIWDQLHDSEAAREMVAIFNEHESTYGRHGINGAVETAKLQATQMGEARHAVISFHNGVYDIASASFEPHCPENWLTTHNDIEYTPAIEGENLKEHAPNFTKWIEHASQGFDGKIRAIKAALYMVLTNRNDWQLFIEVTGQGGSGKSVFASIATLLAGEQNTATGNMRSLDEPQGRAQFVNKRLIVLPDQAKYVGEGNGIKAITGGDAVEINPKYKKQFNTVIDAVVMAVNNEPMSFTERQGGISRRRVIFCFNQVVKTEDKDPLLVQKIKKELPVLVRHLLAVFSNPKQAKEELEQQKSSQEALSVKEDSDPLYSFCSYVEVLDKPAGMFMGVNSNPRRPRIFLYHAYLEFLESHGFKHPLSVTAFGKSFPKVMEEYGATYMKRRTKDGCMYNISLRNSANDWLPKLPPESIG
ncbi:phage/plasmid primase, P4 family [Vibrio rumoiensis]|uniref:DNA primase family protein n=1 Tax=Vibrio rumoiensis TaxID=76258 RepID=UPI0037495836